MKERFQRPQHFLTNHKKFNSYGGIVQLIIVICLLAVSYGTTYLYLQEKQQNQQAHIQNLKKYNLYSKLIFYAGYGGYIHNFKNAVLRNDESRIPLIESQKADILTTLYELKRLEKQPENLKLLDNIEATFRSYFDKHPIVINAISENWNPADTDALVRVDDSGIPATLMYLYIENRKQLDQAIAQHENNYEGITYPFFYATFSLFFLALLFSLYLARRNLNFHIASVENSQTLSLFHHFYDGVIESIHDSIFITDENGIIEECNQKALDFFGYQEEELYGQNVSILIPAGEHKNQHDNYMHSSKTKTKVLNKGRVLQAVNRSNEPLPVKVTISPFQSELGMKYIGVIQDMRTEHDLIHQLESAMRAYKRASNTDFLTGMLNRKGFLSIAPKFIALSSRKSKPIAALMIDIDHFKKINDDLGHDAGDYILKQVTTCLKKALRGQDILARWGGEEFILLLYDTPLELTLEIAERMRELIEQLKPEYNDTPIRLTISIGICHSSAKLHDQQIETLIKCADEALYNAKDNGRNRIEFFGNTKERNQ